MAYSVVSLVDEALEHADRALQIAGPTPTILAYWAYVRALTGQSEHAETALGQLLKLSAQSYVSPVSLAAVESALGRDENALELLAAAFGDRSRALLWLHVDPRFSRLRQHAAFPTLATKFGFVKPRVQES